MPCNDDLLLHGIITSSCSSSSKNFFNRLKIIQSTIFVLDSSTPNLSVRDSTNISTVITASSVYIAIDWGNNYFAVISIITNLLLPSTDTSALHLRYQSSREKIIKEHSSLATCRRQQTEPVDLDHCLRAFTQEEKLEQTYYCSHCKSKQPATKKLQLWKLPPILVRKLNASRTSSVDFPIFIRRSFI